MSALVFRRMPICCRSVSWVGRDVLEVPPFRNRLTLPGLPALSRPNVGRDQIACPSRLCLFHGTRNVHTSLRCYFCVAISSRREDGVVSGGGHSVYLFLTQSGPAYQRCIGALAVRMRYVGINAVARWRVVFAAKGTTWNVRKAVPRFFVETSPQRLRAGIQVSLSSSIFLQHSRFHVWCLCAVFCRHW